MGTDPSRNSATVIEGEPCAKPGTLSSPVHDRHGAKPCNGVGKADRAQESDRDGVGASL